MAGPRDYNTFSEIDPQLFRDIIAGSRNSSTSVSPSASPSGIMAPRVVNMEEEARRSAEEAAALRGGMGITESLRGPVSVEDSIVGQVARSMGANADDPESVATAVTTINTDPPRATAVIQAFESMRPYEEHLALGAGDQTIAALGSPDPLDMPNMEGTTQGFTPDLAEPVSQQEGDAPEPTRYTVQSGDILGRIARRNNTTVDAIMAANPSISDRDDIAIGQELVIPVATETSTDTPAASPPEEQVQQAETPTEETTSTYSTTVNNIFEDFKTLEGESNHLGSDYRDVGITLAYGIVPTSGLQYNHNGTIIDLPSARGQRWSTLSAAGVTRQNFNPANVITDNAEKDGVNRSDYSSDEAWTRAVIQSFEDNVTERANELGVTLNDSATQALTSYTWNTGSGTLSRPALTNTIRELGKDTPNYETIANGFLNRFTRVGGGVMQGLGRRRALEANELLEAVGSPWTIASYRMQRDANNNEQFVFTTTQGGEIVVDTPTNRSLDADSSFPTTNQAV